MCRSANREERGEYLSKGKEGSHLGLGPKKNTALEGELADDATVSERKPHPLKQMAYMLSTTPADVDDGAVSSMFCCTLHCWAQRCKNDIWGATDCSRKNKAQELGYTNECGLIDVEYGGEVRQ